MKLRNIVGTPGPILRAILASQEEYSRGVKEFLDQYKGKYDVALSVTTLPQSPRQHQLTRRHSHEIEVDPKERYFVLLGSITHYLMEKFPDPGDVIEKRFGRIFHLKKSNIKVLIHGAADVTNAELGYVKDYKFASTMSMSYPKEAYIAQLNILRFLMPEEDRVRISQLKNIFIFRDWTYRDKYSELPWKEVDQPIWTEEQCVNYLRERITAHIPYRDIADDDLPLCSSEERWERKSGFAVFPYTKKNKLYEKSAGFAPTKEEADTLARMKNFEKFELVHKPGTSLKCAKFCDARDFCSQYNKIKEQETPDDEAI